MDCNQMNYTSEKTQYLGHIVLNTNLNGGRPEHTKVAEPAKHDSNLKTR